MWRGWCCGWTSYPSGWIRTVCRHSEVDACRWMAVSSLKTLRGRDEAWPCWMCFCGGERREERGGPFYEALSDVTSKNHSKNKLRKHNRGTMMTQPPFATFELSTLQKIVMDYLLSYEVHCVLCTNILHCKGRGRTLIQPSPSSVVSSMLEQI